MIMVLDSSQAAAVFLRERLPPDIRRGLHLLREHDGLSPDSVVAGAVRILLRTHGFDEARFGGGSLREAWTDLMDAVLDDHPERGGAA